MKRWLAEVIDLALNLACTITNHAGGCWLYTGGPFKKLVWWATNVQCEVRHDPERPHDCPYCGKESVFVPFSQIRDSTGNAPTWTYTTSSSAVNVAPFYLRGNTWTS